MPIEVVDCWNLGDFLNNSSFCQTKNSTKAVGIPPNSLEFSLESFAWEFRRVPPNSVEIFAELLANFD